MNLNKHIIQKHLFKSGVGTQKELAKRCDLSINTICGIMNGRSCKYETACKIAEALNVSVEELIEQ